ncbi:cation transporter [Portibacter lacus]|uniref:Cation transporter n=2 Tax=Portibacter lacus TaxID=1099794 RepID=A0AA37SQS4_9BACT|nr:cation transporter [Portibacter lacus]
MLSILILIIFLPSCNAKKPDLETVTAKAKEEASLIDQKTKVRVVKATLETFTIQKILSGRIEADRKVNIKSTSDGQIINYNLLEGKYIKTGEVLIEQDAQELQLQLEQRKNEYDDAIMSKNERIIRDGGFADQDSSVSPQKLEYINILSGLNKAQSALKEIQYRLEEKRTLSPISGWISDIKINDKEYINAGEEICTIIDPSSFEIKIMMLESDALSTKIGTSITAYPLLSPDQEIKANISKINPVVDKNGLVTIYAKIIGSGQHLFEGMNVRVEVESHKKNQLIVPKSALVSRSDRDVIFVYDEASGLAKWKYVTVGYENKDALAIIDGLAEGDLVIAEGNLNLDHDAKVELAESLEK